MQTAYYSLEYHLESISTQDSQFEILNAIWKLNKKNLSAALANVSQYYPHYSLHERSHSETIIRNIESFLGEERIKNLGPTDTWLLLMASFTHDLGMILFNDLIEKEWDTEHFQEYISTLEAWEDGDMSKGAFYFNVIKKIKQKTITPDELEKVADVSPVKMKNYVVLIVSEYFRRIHHKRSENILKGVDERFYKLTNSFYSDQIPGRLLDVLGEVAYLHGADFYQIFKKLEFQSNGISADKIHPRFIAAMLRLGDLLDVDDQRFNIFTEVVTLQPESSVFHKEKHSSIKHLLITPESIEITSDCNKEQVYRIARQWFDWLEQEVENQSKEWSNIAPVKLGGSSPRIPRGKIKVYFKGNNSNDEFLDLRFHISDEKIFEILEGASIYTNAELTFIRELIQNAMDASKIQFWKEVERGTFDFWLKKSLNAPRHNDIIACIIFPDDLPRELFDNFWVYLNIYWENDLQQNLIFEVSDSGTGISNQDLIRLTSDVGQSRLKDVTFQKLLLRMPFWLKPTGAFGIGLQSIFTVNDSFIVKTKAEGEIGKEITFRTARKGKYSSVTITDWEQSRGSVVTVSLPKEKLEKKVTSGGYNDSIVNNYDYFTDEKTIPQIAYIRKFLQSMFSKTEFLKITVFGEPVELIKNETKEKLIPILPTITSSDKIYRCKIEIKHESIQFNVFERQVGSTIEFKFVDKYYEYHAYGELSFRVRDIPIYDSIYSHIAYHTAISWNFQNPMSDKILSLSRDHILSSKKNEYVKHLEKTILPSILPLLKELLLQNKTILEKAFKENTSLLAIYLYNFELLFSIYFDRTKSLFSNLSKAKLPQFLVSKENKEITMGDFYNQENFIIPLINEPYFDDNVFAKEALVDDLEKKDKSIAIIWESDYYKIYISKYYKLTRLHYAPDGIAYFFKYSENSQEMFEIEITGDYNLYLEGFFSKYRQYRSRNYASSYYYKTLAVNHDTKIDFDEMPDFSNYSIICPFKRVNEFLNFRKDVNPNSSFTKMEIFEKIKGQSIRTLIPEKLVEWIIQNRAYTATTLTADDIYNSYAELVAELSASNIDLDDYI